MATCYLSRMALAIVLLWGVVVSGQESHWAYERRTDNLTHDPFVNLTIQGRYVGAIPVSHSDEAPTLGLSCSNGTLDAIVISTGVVIDSQFGASPRILTRIDDQELKGDRAAPVLLADSETLRFNGSRNRIGGTDMLFAKK
jgi:hypothetical protein